jgi:hypothetical protein
MFSSKRNSSKKVLKSDGESKEIHIETEQSRKLKKALKDISEQIKSLVLQKVFFSDNAKPYQRLGAVVQRKTVGKSNVPTQNITKVLGELKLNLANCHDEFKESPDVNMEEINSLVAQLQGYLLDLKQRNINSTAQDLTPVMKVEINTLLDSVDLQCVDLTKNVSAESGYEPPAHRSLWLKK